MVHSTPDLPAMLRAGERQDGASGVGNLWLTKLR
jgi:hypothetical protein